MHGPPPPQGHARMHGQPSAQQEQLGECKGLSVRGEFRMNSPRQLEPGVRRRSRNAGGAVAAACNSGASRGLIGLYQPMRHNGVTGMNIESLKQTDKSTHGSRIPSDVAPSKADRRDEFETGKHERARAEKQSNEQKAAIKDAPHSTGR